MNKLKRLEARGQSLWLDYLKRSLIEKGESRTLIERDALKGVTSNRSIFEKAIGETDEYAEAPNAFQAQADRSISAIYEHLAIADIRAAADVLHPVYEQSQGREGYIGLECSSYLANDTEATVSEAQRLRAAVDRPNLMVKVPATPAGIPRFQHSTGQAYKGGPNSGVFPQVTCDDHSDIDISGHSYSFGIVKAAQASGDLAVLVERDRRALRVTSSMSMQALKSCRTQSMQRSNSALS